MINGSPAIPIIQSAGVLQASDWTSVPIAGKSGPLDRHPRRLRQRCGVQAEWPRGPDQGVPDFAYQDKYQLAFDKEYDLLPGDDHRDEGTVLRPGFAPFLTALPNSVQYPSNTTWATVKSKIQQTIGLAVTGSPMTELSNLQQIATTSAS